MVRIATLAAALAALALPVEAAARDLPRTILQDDATLLHRGPGERERALDELHALGVDTIRVLVVWRKHAPAPSSARRPLDFDATDANAYPAGTFAALDALKAGADARGLELLLTPTGPGPAWASGCERGSLATRQACAPAPDDFRRFVTALGRRYPDQRHWAIWNEPNNPRWLVPQFDGRRPVSPAHYRRLVAAAAAALRATGHGSDELLAGEAAPIGLSAGAPFSRPMPPGIFLRRLLCRRCGRLPGVTGLAHHAYTRGGSRPPRSPSLRDELAPADLGRLARLVAVASRHGILPRGAGVHLTEGGWQTSPPDRLFGVTLLQQARFLNELEWMVRAHPRVRSVGQYLLRDELRTSGFQSGLRFINGRAKPALAAFRTPIWVRRSGRRTVTVWGRARGRPARGSAQIQRRLPGRPWRTLRSVRTDREILARFASTVPARWRIRHGRQTSRVATEARR